MIVNRVFCYSKEVAKKNGIRLPIIELVLLTVGFIIWIIVNAMMLESGTLFTISIIIFMTLLIYYSLILGLRMRNRMTGYATDTNGRIFKAMTVNNGQGLYFGGVAAGGLIDQIAGNDSGIGESLGGAVGAAAQFYAMNRSAKYMSHPEIVAKIVESAPNITGAEVFEILKVHSITDQGKTVKVNCDYKILRTNKIKYAKNLTIEKAFNMFDDLISVLNTHR
ncbi:MAG TPA: hypothetical protein IAC20_06240 [Candidatus Faecisoma merdavium]|nr:hypothetical protein [Candidatus Faecisoma merdavium]